MRSSKAEPVKNAVASPGVLATKIKNIRILKKKREMSRKQLKVEIDQILQSLPDENLVGVLEYLKTAQKMSAEKITLAKNFNQILEEDKNLLIRLAQ
jgi:hypothetical protein